MNVFTRRPSTGSEVMEEHLRADSDVTEKPHFRFEVGLPDV